MGLRINDTIPDLKLQTSQGEIASFHDWIGDSWAILFSHPKDFTPVCTTEFGAVAQLAEEWEARNTKVIGLSVDSVEEHMKWIGDIEQVAEAPVGFPIIADEDLAISKQLDMLPADAYLPDGRTAADSASVRVVFIIAPNKKLQLSMTYPMSVGRNFAEVLRALDALQASYETPIATPANWTMGQDVIVALSLDDTAAKERFGEFDSVLPYLRKTKAPS
ncbi:peroxiredoxin [Tropicimonas marinistellae]|uniref:peroxiredoxin n=1 Tax=Tropicimonas marinistellae TaxID=1739787 RepID=UPI00082ECBF8|nr:peroxiredoxin [Tropicimonas marinistellae]